MSKLRKQKRQMIKGADSEFKALADAVTRAVRARTLAAEAINSMEQVIKRLEGKFDKRGELAEATHTRDRARRSYRMANTTICDALERLRAIGVPEEVLRNLAKASVEVDTRVDFDTDPARATFLAMVKRHRLAISPNRKVSAKIDFEKDPEAATLALVTERQRGFR